MMRTNLNSEIDPNGTGGKGDFLLLLREKLLDLAQKIHDVVRKE